MMRIFLVVLLMVLNIKPITAEQKIVFEDMSPDLLFYGQGGSGKTHTGADKAILIGSMYKNNRVFLIRKKKVDLRTTLWDKFSKRLPDDLIVKRDENRMYYKIRNGTEFFGLGLDTTLDVNKLASTECGFQVVEEMLELIEKNYNEKLKRACRLPNVPFHQTLGLCNPGAPSHWIHKKWFMQKNKGFKSVFGKTLPPPFLPKSYYDWLESLTGVFRQRYKEGLWVAFEGLVYPFDPRKHIVERFKIPSDWERRLAVDFGFSHPFVAQWWAISPSEIWYMYREIYMTRRLVKNHAKDIVKYCEEDNIEPVAICDHDAEDRATLEDAGIDTIPADKKRLAGQQVVCEKFEQDKIFYFEDALVEKDIAQELQNKPTKTVDEFGTYIWATKGKEDMIKQKDDGMDTTRYAMVGTEGFAEALRTADWNTDPE